MMTTGFKFLAATLATLAVLTTSAFSFPQEQQQDEQQDEDSTVQCFLPVPGEFTPALCYFIPQEEEES